MMPFAVLTSRSEFEAHRGDERAHRQFVEQLIVSSAEAGRTRSIAGYCLVCDEAVEFELASPPLSLRESMMCPQCGLNNRQRFIATMALAACARRGADAVVYAMESCTPFYAALSTRLGSGIVGSEYMGPDCVPGETVGGLRHEDVTRLSFPDASFDVIASNDVFEHVPDIDKALRESRRVLRPQGELLFTIPFYGTDVSTRHATIVDGRPEFLGEPEYHGDPVRPTEGTPVFWHFGWDILDRCVVNGFGDAAALAYYSPTYGHLGGGLQLAFRATV